MARIVREVEVGGRKLKALFDTGAANTFIARSALPPDVVRVQVPQFTVALGGKVFTVREECILTGRIEGLSFSTDAIVVEEIGSVDGQEIELLIGARTMEKWEIALDMKSGELDLSGLRRREFTEF